MINTDSPFKRFISEFKRRKVFRVALVYIIGAWILLQVAEVTFEPLNVPGWAMPFLIILAIVGFALAIVLPFVDTSPDKDQDYFCEGMAEEIINALPKIKDVHVASRTASFQFKGETIDITENGERLNVNTVLEGSVRKAGNQLRDNPRFKTLLNID